MALVHFDPPPFNLTGVTLVELPASWKKKEFLTKEAIPMIHGVVVDGHENGFFLAHGLDIMSYTPPDGFQTIARNGSIRQMGMTPVVFPGTVDVPAWSSPSVRGAFYVRMDDVARVVQLGKRASEFKNADPWRQQPVAVTEVRGHDEQASCLTCLVVWLA
jgi:hypothetical protein